MTDSAPAGACDCHIHVYEDGYELAPTATFTPPHAPASAYREQQRELGTERVLVVQPTGYGFDNRCTLAAIEALGPGARGIAVVKPDTSQLGLDRLHAMGMRGVRYMMLPGGVLGWEGLEETAMRIADLGWCVNLQLDGRELPQHAARLARLPCRLVIDHVGKFLGPTTVDSPGFVALLRLLDAGHCWVKLAAPYESSRSGPPDYADVAPLVHTLAARFAERCLFASNWPHPNVKPTPSSAALRDWVRRAVDDDVTWRRLLVQNPAELYGF